MELANESFVDVLSDLTGATLVNDSNYTHITLFDPGKKWSVPDIEISKF